MAAIDKESFLGINIQELAQNLKLDLPAYAKPLFIRLMSQLEHTGTFKAIKNTLVDDGFNIKKLTDIVYYFDPKEQNCDLILS